MYQDDLDKMALKGARFGFVFGVIFGVFGALFCSSWTKKPTTHERVEDAKPQVGVGQVWQSLFDDPFKTPLTFVVTATSNGFVKYWAYSHDTNYGIINSDMESSFIRGAKRVK